MYSPYNSAPPAGLYPAMGAPGGVQWVFTERSNIPPNAVIGGRDSNGEALYVGRAREAGDVIPGKVVRSHGCCYVAYAGKEHCHHHYEILLATGMCQWISASGGYVPSGAVQGGHTASGEPLYVGRAFHHGSQAVGKIQPSHGCCYISYAGGEHSHRQYEVLVAASVAPPAVYSPYQVSYPGYPSR